MIEKSKFWFIKIRHGLPTADISSYQFLIGKKYIVFAIGNLELDYLMFYNFSHDEIDAQNQQRYHSTHSAGKLHIAMVCSNKIHHSA